MGAAIGQFLEIETLGSLAVGLVIILTLDFHPKGDAYRCGISISFLSLSCRSVEHARGKFASMWKAASMRHQELRLPILPNPASTSDDKAR
jgi:hypothetical protein